MNLIFNIIYSTLQGDKLMVNKKVNFEKLGLIFSIEQRIYESINELLHAKNLLDFGEITKESYELKKKT